ncbi:MAG: acyl-CoA dehydrogenase family protein [Gulosibacter sp.]|uniref:acyl-CoA dehydrogenase family protein n=1 Tax=Gulosibacter sp. TaxID=2817531 RepID=UPI003F924F36
MTQVIDQHKNGGAPDSAGATARPRVSADQLPEHVREELSLGTDYEVLAEKFRPLFQQIAETAVERERVRRLPQAEIELLKRAGFGAVRVPKKYGGDGASVPQLIELLTELAAADSNIAQALRGHFAYVEDRLNQHATSDQSAWFARFVAGETAGNAWTEVGAVKVGDINTRVSETAEGLRVNGAKFYTTGSIYADWLDVYAGRDSDNEPVIALVNRHQPGVAISDDWDGFGQRTTGSGTTVFTNAAVDAENITVFTERFRYQTAFYQLVHLATLAGIVEAASAEVAKQAAARKRVFSHGSSDQWSQDPLVQQVVGVATSQGFAARAIAVRAAETSQDAYLARFFGDQDQDQDTEQRINQRAELESAQGQVVIIDLALDATSKLFNALSASAASEAKKLDRYWRNARTVSSHNPVVFKQRIVGDWAINGTELPYAWAIGSQKEDAK